MIAHSALTQGSILYRSGSIWTTLTPGSSGQILTSGGSAANPSWQSAAGAGTVTNVYCGTGLACSPSPIVGIGTASLATIGSGSMMANIGTSTLAPSATTGSAFLDLVFGSTQGSILYRAGLLWTVLTPGSAHQALLTGGSAANPSWAGIGTASLSATGTASSSTYLRGDNSWATAGFSSCTQVSGTGTATCAGGYTMTGGGAYAGSNWILNSYPSGSNSWACDNACRFTGGTVDCSASCTAYAVCCH